MIFVFKNMLAKIGIICPIKQACIPWCAESQYFRCSGIVSQQSLLAFSTYFTALLKFSGKFTEKPGEIQLLLILRSFLRTFGRTFHHFSCIFCTNCVPQNMGLFVFSVFNLIGKYETKIAAKHSSPPLELNSLGFISWNWYRISSRTSAVFSRVNNEHKYILGSLS